MNTGIAWHLHQVSVLVILGAIAMMVIS